MDSLKIADDEAQSGNTVATSTTDVLSQASAQADAGGSAGGAGGAGVNAQMNDTLSSISSALLALKASVETMNTKLGQVHASVQTQPAQVRFSTSDMEEPANSAKFSSD